MLGNSQSECDETILRLDFLHETQSITDLSIYQKLHDEFDVLSRRIKKIIQQVESNWNILIALPQTRNRQLI